jgi:hypothetical protein
MPEWVRSFVLQCIPRRAGQARAAGAAPQPCLGVIDPTNEDYLDHPPSPRDLLGDNRATTLRSPCVHLIFDPRVPMVGTVGNYDHAELPPTGNNFATTCRTG